MKDKERLKNYQRREEAKEMWQLDAMQGFGQDHGKEKLC